jgi:ketosteroid isomerase-like protein
MASPEDLEEAIRAGYAAISRRDIDAWLAGFHPDAELHELPSAPDTDIYRGHDGLRRWLESQAEAFTQWQWTPQVLDARSDRVLLRVHMTATAASGVTGDVWLFHLIELRDGKATRVSGFLDESEAREALGMRE